MLGLKRLCNPVSPVGAPGYYENTIVGMKAYCDGFAQGRPARRRRSGRLHQRPRHRRRQGDRRRRRSCSSCSSRPPTSSTSWRCRSPRRRRSRVPELRAGRRDASGSTRSPTARTRSPSTRPTSRSCWTGTRRGSRPPTRCGTSTSTTSRSPRARTQGPVQQQIQAGTADLEWDTVVPTPNIPSLQAAKDTAAGHLPGSGHQPVPAVQPAEPEQRRRAGERQGAPGASSTPSTRSRSGRSTAVRRSTPRWTR